MAEDATPTDAVTSEEEFGPRTDLALVVAALGGGPGDERDSGVRRDAAPAVDSDWSEDDWPHDAAA